MFALRHGVEVVVEPCNINKNRKAPIVLVKSRKKRHETTDNLPARATVHPPIHVKGLQYHLTKATVDGAKGRREEMQTAEPRYITPSWIRPPIASTNLSRYAHDSHLNNKIQRHNKVTPKAKHRKPKQQLVRPKTYGKKLHAGPGTLAGNVLPMAKPKR